MNIGLNMLPSDFMSYLGYSTGEFEAVQPVVLVAFDAVD